MYEIFIILYNDTSEIGIFIHICTSSNLMNIYPFLITECLFVLNAHGNILKFFLLSIVFIALMLIWCITRKIKFHRRYVV